MKANTQYTDMFGSAAADISDHLQNDLIKLAQEFKIDLNRFKPVGITIYGTEKFNISFLCEDLDKSTDDEKHVVKLMVNDDREDILSYLFKRLEVILYLKNDEAYSKIEKYEELDLDDYII